MADTLISPAVGGIVWICSAGLVGLCSKRLQRDAGSFVVPLMGVLGAFVFAAQMINFSIPGTGSSGHLGGGMLLSILLGPWAAFLTMASVLTVQSLFFADGGLLALGCNMFNLGFFPCFVVYPLLYKPFVGVHPGRRRLMVGAVLASVISMQLGAFGVVLETVFSGVSSLPFTTFVALMQPIHLAIGLVEGFVTAVVVLFVWQARPELLASPRASVPGLAETTRPRSVRGLALSFVLAACVVGGVLSWYASDKPDGLEWAMLHTSGSEALPDREGAVYEALRRVQELTALLPDYGFRTIEPVEPAESATSAELAESSTPSVAGGSDMEALAGTSLSGLLGGALTLFMAAGIGFVLKRRKTAA